MIIAILGEPATGKTTLMKEIKASLEPMQPHQKPFYHYTAPGVVLWGKYDQGTFQGTDKLSMGVQPLAVDFAMMARQKVILFEGDRLGTMSFFEAVKPYHEIKVYMLVTSEEEKARRHIARQDTQTEKFLKAKKTKLQNISKQMPVETLVCETEHDISLLKEAILRTLRGAAPK